MPKNNTPSAYKVEVYIELEYQKCFIAFHATLRILYKFHTPLDN